MLISKRFLTMLEMTLADVRNDMLTIFCLLAMSRDKPYCVYILTNRTNKVMYVGMTNDLQRRVREHKSRLIEGFTKKYNVDKLVYFEETDDVLSAIAREKEIKKWRREKKDMLVVTINPDWNELGEEGVW